MKRLLAFLMVLSCCSMPTSADVPRAPSDDTIREFHQAIADGDERQVSEMLEVYPDLLEARRNDGGMTDDNQCYTPLCTAVQYNQVKIVAMLIARGASVEAPGTGTGKTPLYHAALLGHAQIINLLLDAGADIDGNMDANDPYGATPLRLALCWNRPEAARLLVQRGARIDIYSAAGLGWTNWVARQLANDPAQATRKDAWGLSPMTYACTMGCAAVAEELLNHGGADVEGRSSVDQGTQLDIAAINGYTDLAAVLIKHGADVNSRNNAGQTPLDFAVKSRQQEVAQLLRDHGGKSGAGI